MSLYADDSKLYQNISDTVDCDNLQSDLRSVEKWCKTWKLKLNHNKCMVISFTNKKKPIKFNYILNNCALSRVDTVKDLGVFLTHNFSFATHVNYVTVKAFKLLGFLKRTAFDFNNTKTLKTLFTTLVRPHLEYASQVWSPHQKYLIQRIERVQRKFINYLCWKSGIDYSN